DEAVAELVEKIARSSPLTVGIGKEAFYAQVELDEHRAYDLTKSVMAMNALAADAQEGICAFLEKREPTWRGSLSRPRAERRGAATEDVSCSRRPQGQKAAEQKPEREPEPLDDGHEG